MALQQSIVRNSLNPQHSEWVHVWNHVKFTTSFLLQNQDIIQILAFQAERREVEIRHQFFREIKALTLWCVHYPCVHSIRDKTSVFFHLLRLFKQQYRTFFPATWKFTLLEKYPDNSQIGETPLSMDSSKPQEKSAIPLHYKLAVWVLLGSTLVSLFFVLWHGFQQDCCWSMC